MTLSSDVPLQKLIIPLWWSLAISASPSWHVCVLPAAWAEQKQGEVTEALCSHSSGQEATWRAQCSDRGAWCSRISLPFATEADGPASMQMRGMVGGS